MRSIRLLSVLLMSVALQAVTAENSMLNLDRPSTLEPRQAQFVVQHRFYGRIDENTLDTFFGMSEGANVGLGIRLSPIKNFELSVNHVFLYKEYRIGAGYAFNTVIPGCRAQAGFEWVSFKSGRFVEGFWKEDRKAVWFGRLDIRGPSILFLTPVANIGYDTDDRTTGFGFGLDCAVSGKLSLIGEFFPRVNRSTWEGSRSSHCFAAGVQVKTYGHHFLFQLGNSTELGLRRMMRGAPSRNLMFGFGIKRLLE